MELEAWVISAVLSKREVVIGVRRASWRATGCLGHYYKSKNEKYKCNRSD